jgi:gamma-D-glutamyl-L-lysine dipeptidyl-peptidase
MRFGICNLSMVAVRLEPSHRSEMVTQLLYGDLMEIIEKADEWVKVRMLFDNYEGWIDCRQYLPLYNDNFENLSNFGSSITLDIVQVLVNETKKYMIPVVLGSTLPFVANKSFYFNDDKYTFEGNVRSRKDASDKNTVVENAYMYLDTPYLWGGRSPFGIDCSGLVQMAYKLSGINLPRDAHQQAQQGTAVNFISEASQGDLAFFDNDKGIITHVGIILSGSNIIHASGRVRIDTLDHEGIYNNSLKKYTHKLRIIRKIV